MEKLYLKTYDKKGNRAYFPVVYSPVTGKGTVYRLPFKRANDAVEWSREQTRKLEYPGLDHATG